MSTTWTGMARWLRSDLDSSGVEVTTSISGNQGLIQVSALGEEGEFVNYGQLEARITDPELRARYLMTIPNHRNLGALVQLEQKQIPSFAEYEAVPDTGLLDDFSDTASISGR